MAPEPTKRKKQKSPANVATLHPDVPSAKQLPLPPPFAPRDEIGAPAAEVRTIFSIGHSNHGPGTFLALLWQHDLRTLVDVRSAPYSRYAPHFNRDCLAALLQDANIVYVWAGDTLGGRPDDPSCYREGIVRKGNVDYAAVAEKAWYQEGLRHLLACAANGATVIMCSEEDPRRCHRHRLIEPSLRDRGVNVLHIRKDGTLEANEPGETNLPDLPSPQLTLLGFEA